MARSVTMFDRKLFGKNWVQILFWAFFGIIIVGNSAFFFSINFLALKLCPCIARKNGTTNEIWLGICIVTIVLVWHISQTGLLQSSFEALGSSLHAPCAKQEANLFPFSDWLLEWRRSLTIVGISRIVYSSFNYTFIFKYLKAEKFLKLLK